MEQTEIVEIIIILTIVLFTFFFIREMMAWCTKNNQVISVCNRNTKKLSEIHDLLQKILN